jgi:hypothetical protein
VTSTQTVAIIGAGPGGLAAARYLRQAGFAPTLFDRADGVGGQWRVGAPQSRVWPGMRTNSSRVMTAFSDLAHPPGTAVYPTAEQVGAYLERYAAHFDLLDGARLGTRVEDVARAEEAGTDGRAWRVRARGPDGAARAETFSHVVVASGWCGRPVAPVVDGLPGFTGRGGVAHAAAYRGAAPYRGAARAGGRRQHQRARGSRASWRSRALRARWWRVGGSATSCRSCWPACPRTTWRSRASPRSPARRSRPSPRRRRSRRSSCRRAAARSSSARRRRPTTCSPRGSRCRSTTCRSSPRGASCRGRGSRAWRARRRGSTDGSAEEFDAILLGTGYAPDLSYLAPDVRAVLGAPPVLHDLTFHPELPGLAFLGQFEQVGPHLPTLELQARWIAYAWSGRVAPPTREAMAARLAAAPAHGVPMQVAARRFATAAGVEPDPRSWPTLTRALLFGPMSPASFRLSGPDALPDAAARVAADAAAFGAGADRALSPEQTAQLRALATARADADLAALAAPLKAYAPPSPGSPARSASTTAERPQPARA